MKQLIEKEIEKLTADEKLELIEQLWDDINEKKMGTGTPAHHKKILTERIEKLNSGKTTFKPWEEIKQKYLP